MKCAGPLGNDIGCPNEPTLQPYAITPTYCEGCDAVHGIIGLHKEDGICQSCWDRSHVHVMSLLLQQEHGWPEFLTRQVMIAVRPIAQLEDDICAGMEWGIARSEHQ